MCAITRPVMAFCFKCESSMPAPRYLESYLAEKVIRQDWAIVLATLSHTFTSWRIQLGFA